MSVVVRNRLTGKLEREQIYGEEAIQFLYGDDIISRLFGRPLLSFVSKTPLFSSLYGWLQNRPASKKKIKSFVEKYGIDASEFEKNLDAFTSFNDFFTRELKLDARPIANDSDVAIIPTDGRFLAVPDVSNSNGFIVKGKTFELSSLLQNDELSQRYEKGVMVIGRLCPTDYHRFHFPCDCTPAEALNINGWLYSVNPIALKRNCEIYTQNKRCYTLLETEQFGTVLFMEVGATSVGSILQTFEPDTTYEKGDEKGYFSFGASALVILFEKGRIQLDDDLLATNHDKIELRCLLGQSMGTALHQ